MKEMMITTSILLLAVILIRQLCKGRISLRLQYALWLPVVMKLLLFPIPFIDSSFSVLNLLPYTEELSGAQINGTQTDNTYPAGIGNGEAENHIQAAGGQTGSTSAQGTSIEADLSKTGLGEETQTDKGAGAVQVISILKWLLLSGTIFVTLCMIVYNLKFMRLLHKHRIVYEGGYKGLMVYLVEGLASPCLYGRSIYITPDMAGEEEKLSHILSHEYCHYRHGDHWWAPVRCICLALYWYHPLVWLAVYLSKKDCEMACDEGVLRLLGDDKRIPYGETLIWLIGTGRKQRTGTKPGAYFSAATTMSGGFRSLRERIGMIAKAPKTMLWAGAAVILCVGFILAGTITGSRAEIKQQDMAGEQPAADGQPAADEQPTVSLPSEEDILQMPDEQSQINELMQEQSVNHHIIYIRSIDKSQKAIDDYFFAEEGGERLGLPFEEGTPLQLAQNCSFYINYEIGTIEKTEVTFEDFFTAAKWDIDDNNTEICEAVFEEGKIIEITMFNPYQGISYNDTYEETWFYSWIEEYSLEESYRADISDAPGMERVEVYVGNIGDGESGMVVVKSEEGKVLYVRDAHVTRAGWDNIYCGTIDGRDYLFSLRIEIRGNYGGMRYQAFRLDGEGNILQLGGSDFGYNYDYGENGFNQESYYLWAEAMNPYLENSFLLLSTQEGELRTKKAAEYMKYEKEALLQKIKAGF